MIRHIVLTKFKPDTAEDKIASIYALVISAFTWLYYAVINPDYFANKISGAVKEAEALNMPVEDVDQVRNTVEFIFDAFTHSTITLFGYIAIGFFYTIILVMLFRSRPKAFGI